MPHVLGRRQSDPNDREDAPTGHLGAYRARDGSSGAEVHLDLDRPHVGLVVGKRGYGKSYTLGVLAEELARERGVAPVIADPMGIFGSLSDLGAEVVSHPRVAADALAPRTWCDLLGLVADSPAGALVWQAAGARSTLDGMREFVAAADTKADRATRRAADNHLAVAESWDAFSPEGLTASDLLVSLVDSGKSAGPCWTSRGSTPNRRTRSCEPWPAASTTTASEENPPGFRGSSSTRPTPSSTGFPLQPCGRF